MTTIHNSTPPSLDLVLFMPCIICTIANHCVIGLNLSSIPGVSHCYGSQCTVLLYLPYHHEQIP